MKKKRKVPDSQHQLADSNEEVYFSHWLMELKKTGYIKQFRRSKSVVLTQPVKIIVNNKQFTLLREFSYTPDYTVWWEEKAIDVFIGFSQSKIHSAFMYVNRPEILKFSYEVKPPIDKRGTISNFIVKQKMIYKHHNQLIHLVISEELYPKTFTPRYYMKKKKKIDFRTRTLQEFINLRKLI